jgi:hypothetical protein
MDEFTKAFAGRQNDARYNIARYNIAHYIDRLKTENDPVKRDVLLKLLAAEEAKAAACAKSPLTRL